MKLLSYPHFLTTGSAQLTGQFRAVGIHPSSEVDLVDIDGVRLGVGALVPLSTSGASVVAVRRAPDSIAGAANAGSELQAGQKLVLQLYEACDELTPPTSRDPVFRQGIIQAADLGVVAGGANLIARLPFQGRAMACIRFGRLTSPQDLTLVIIGVTYGTRANPQTQFVEKTAETWWNGGASAPVITAGPNAPNLQCRQVYVGGFGDGAEAFDELQLYVFGPAGAGRAELTGEAFGERRV